MPNPIKRDIAKEITDLILEKIERGVMPWRRPWKTMGATGAPLRANGIRYSGINAIYLWAVADNLGYRSQYWMTRNQAETLDAFVRRDAQPHPSIYFNVARKSDVNTVTGRENSRLIRFMRSYTVYNASEIEGLPDHYYPTPFVEKPPKPSEQRDAIRTFFSPIPIEVRHGGEEAYYSPAGDFVQMPRKNRFPSEDHYASTLGHEIGHASGASHRLARQFGKRFGDKAYAFEELIADQISARICYELGLPAELHDSHASYLDHWVSILKSDKSAIITAAAKADQAFTWLAAFSGHGAPTKEKSDASHPIPTHA